MSASKMLLDVCVCCWMLYKTTSQAVLHYGTGCILTGNFSVMFRLKTLAGHCKLLHSPAVQLLNKSVCIFMETC